MNYIIIARPLIGAAIGYVTNWIAVKMMFRPLNPIKIGKFTLPFTPGIIPRNKERLAKAIGDSVSQNLLNEETLKENLLSEEMTNGLREKIEITLEEVLNNDKSLEMIICEHIDNKKYNEVISTINKALTKKILNAVKEANIGMILVNEIESVAEEKLRGSMLGLLGGNSIVAKISEEIPDRIDEYIDNNGQELIYKMVEKEIERYTQNEIAHLAVKIKENNIDLTEITIGIYEKLIIEKLPMALNTLNISNVITNKINSMDMLELEKLILQIMKKELNALVNLGAIIGFILGLLNLVI